VVEHSRSRVDLTRRGHLVWLHPQVPFAERSLGVPRLGGGRRFAPAQGLTEELDAVGPLQQPVQHGVRDRGVANGLVPVSDRELARDDRRVQLGTVLDHLEQIGRLIGVEDESGNRR